MGFKFRRSFQVLPGIRLNVGRRSTSMSFGGRGARVSVSPAGTRSTVSIPGTGISHTSFQGRSQGVSERSEPGAFRRAVGWIVFALLLVVIATMAFTPH